MEIIIKTASSQTYKTAELLDFIYDEMRQLVSCSLLDYCDAWVLEDNVTVEDELVEEGAKHIYLHVDQNSVYESCLEYVSSYLIYDYDRLQAFKKFESSISEAFFSEFLFEDFKLHEFDSMEDFKCHMAVLAFPFVVAREVDSVLMELEDLEYKLEETEQ